MIEDQKAVKEPNGPEPGYVHPCSNSRGNYLKKIVTVIVLFFASTPVIIFTLSLSLFFVPAASFDIVSGFSENVNAKSVHLDTVISNKNNLSLIHI